MTWDTEAMIATMTTPEKAKAFIACMNRLFELAADADIIVEVEVRKPPPRRAKKSTSGANQNG